MMLTVVGTIALDTMGLVATLPEAETTAGVTQLRAEMPGGTAGNVAAALARLGAPPRLVSAVGADFAGSAYERALLAAGVSLDGVERVDDAITSRAYVFHEPSGKQVTFFHAGGGRAFRGATPIRGRAHFSAGEIARYPSLMQQADWVSFDPGQETFHRPLDEIAACFAHVDVLFLNRHELARIENEGSWPIARLLELGVEAVVESRGGEGTLVHTPKGRFAAPAPPVETIADPTGAGDAHRAGFLFALDRGADLGAAARFAGIMGAFAIEHVGAQTGLPTLAQATARHEAFWKERPFK